MHLSQGYTYHLSILQSVISISKIVPVYLVVLDTPAQIEEITWQQFDISLPEKLVVKTVANRKFGFKSNTLWFRRGVEQILADIACIHKTTWFYTRNVKTAAYFFATRARRNSQIRYVFECHQLYSQNLAGEAKFLDAKSEHHREQLIFKNADVLFANTSVLIRQINRLFGATAERLPVAVRASDVRNDLPTVDEYNARTYDFIYAGSFNAWKGVDVLLGALSLIHDRGWAGKALLVGVTSDAHDKWTKAIRDSGLSERVDLETRVTRQRAIALMDSAKLGVVPNSLLDDSVFNTSPLKIFDYAARGLPMILASVPALLADVKLEDVSWFVSDDVEDLALVLSEALEQHTTVSSSNIKWAQSHTWDERARRLVNHLAVSG